ncbi:MAG: hypothetical protein MZV70_21460 [Desulfobacterales bacterium]|nr:hypothetical protein [Desulfobacterales bacterium]
MGYPLAYFMAKQKQVWRDALMVLIIIPFWTNFLVRTYALKSVLATGGTAQFIPDEFASGQPADESIVQ